LKHVETTFLQKMCSNQVCDEPKKPPEPATERLGKLPAEEELEDLALVKACHQVPATTLSIFVERFFQWKKCESPEKNSPRNSDSYFTASLLIKRKRSAAENIPPLGTQEMNGRQETRRSRW